MASRLSALARWRAHLEEVIGISNAAEIIDPFETVEWSKLATTDHIDRLQSQVDRLAEGLAENNRRIADMQNQIRRDLLLVTGGQFFALIAAVAAVLGFG